MFFYTSNTAFHHGSRALGLLCIVLCLSRLHGAEEPDPPGIPALERLAVDQGALRRQIQLLLATAESAQEAGEWSEAMTLAHQAHLADAVLEISGHKPLGAGEIVTRYQVRLMTHAGDEYMRLIASPAVPRSVRLEMIELLAVGTGFRLVELPDVTAETRAELTSIEQDRARLEERILRRGTDDELIDELAETYLDAKEVYLEAGHPDLAYNALEDGFDREVELGRIGSDAMLSFDVGSFSMNYLRQHLESVWLILFSDRVSEERKRAQLDLLREAVMKNDFANEK